LPTSATSIEKALPVFGALAVAVSIVIGLLNYKK
jgi:hypothetical protein